MKSVQPKAASVGRDFVDSVKGCKSRRILRVWETTAVSQVGESNPDYPPRESRDQLMGSPKERRKKTYGKSRFITHIQISEADRPC